MFYHNIFAGSQTKIFRLVSLQQQVPLNVYLENSFNFRLCIKVFIHTMVLIVTKVSHQESTSLSLYTLMFFMKIDFALCLLCVVKDVHLLCWCMTRNRLTNIFFIIFKHKKNFKMQIIQKLFQHLHMN